MADLLIANLILCIFLYDFYILYEKFIRWLTEQKKKYNNNNELINFIVTMG